jgi:chromatin segregation and condensation protein Rec8/ScpA/Scc1 (kleisin family)
MSSEAADTQKRQTSGAGAGGDGIADDFRQNVIGWVKLDNQIRELNNRVRELREERADMAERVRYSMDEKDTDAAVEIDSSRLTFGERNYSKPISRKFLRQCLGECISDASSVDKLMDYIISKLEVSTKWEVKRSFATRKSKGEKDEKDTSDTE